ILIDQCEEDGAPCGGGLRSRLFQRSGYTRALGFGKAFFEFEACLCQIEEPLAAVLLAGLLLDKATLDELLQHAGEALLGNAQDIKQFGDRDAGVTADKVND